MDSKTTETSLLASALDALARGLRVFPLKVRGKFPLPGSHGVLDATDNEEQVRRWWARAPFNIGVTGGVILDMDEGIRNIQEAQNFALLTGLPPTLTIRTGRRPGFGVQMHFSGSTENHLYQSHGVTGEIRSRNQYGLYAGSIHPQSGECYEIILDLPVAPWPADSALSKPSFGRRASGVEEKAINIYRAREIFEGLLGDAQEASQGERNYTAHRVTWFAARAFLAGVFKLDFDEYWPALTETELKKRIACVVAPHYRKGERNVEKMLRDSWRYGLQAGRLALDIYEGDFEQLFAGTDGRDEQLHRLLSGVTTDFPSAIDAKDHLAKVLDEKGFDDEGKKRVLRYSGLIDRAAGQLLIELQVEKFLTEGAE